MTIRTASAADFAFLAAHDPHIAPDELSSVLALGRILIAEIDGDPVGWLRWNLFWDNTPFVNLLYVLEPWRGQGIGSALMLRWEADRSGYPAVMTSTQADEQAQHFYRKLGYRDAGALLLPGEPLEILFYKSI